MALADLMELSESKTFTKKVGISEERIKAQIPALRQYVSFWRAYPDIFVEFLCGSNPEKIKCQSELNTQEHILPYFELLI